MIGSIFPVRQLFCERSREVEEDRFAAWWKWARRRRACGRRGGVAPGRAFAAPGFDWRLAAAALAGWTGAGCVLSLALAAATYYGRALRWAVFLKPLKGPPVDTQPAFGHRDRLHGHHAVRTPRRVRAAVPDRG